MQLVKLGHPVPEWILADILYGNITKIHEDFLQLKIEQQRISNFVPDAELEQEERSSYVPHCDITANDEVQENDDAAEVEDAQLIGGGEDLNKMLLTSSGFTDLPNLSGPETADSLLQIHTCVRQSLSDVQNAEQDTLDRTTY